MHDEQSSAVQNSCSSTQLKTKKKTTAKREEGETKRIKKRLRDAEEVESMEKPLDEALVFLNHLVQIGKETDT